MEINNNSLKLAADQGVTVCPFTTTSCSRVDNTVHKLQHRRDSLIMPSYMGNFNNEEPISVMPQDNHLVDSRPQNADWRNYISAPNKYFGAHVSKNQDTSARQYREIISHRANDKSTQRVVQAKKKRLFKDFYKHLKSSKVRALSSADCSTVDGTNYRHRLETMPRRVLRMARYGAAGSNN